jgi:hypothetical protein
VQILASLRSKQSVGYGEQPQDLRLNRREGIGNSFHQPVAILRFVFAENVFDSWCFDERISIVLSTIVSRNTPSMALDHAIVAALALI